MFSFSSLLMSMSLGKHVETFLQQELPGLRRKVEAAMLLNLELEGGKWPTLTGAAFLRVN